MSALSRTLCYSLLLSIGSAALLGQVTSKVETFEVAFDSDDPVRRQAIPQSAGAHGDRFIHRDRAVQANGAASMLELGTDEEIFKAHMQDLVGHGMHRRILEYSRHQGWACDTAGDVIDVNMTMVKCKSLCDRGLDCTCFQFDKQTLSCSLQKAASCVNDKCQRSPSSDLYIQKAIWAKDPLRLVRHQGLDCHGGKGAVELDAPESVLNDLTLKQCKERCGADEKCTCFKWDRTLGECTKMTDCRTRECAKSGTTDTYLHEAVYNGYEAKHGGTDW